MFDQCLKLYNFYKDKAMKKIVITKVMVEQYRGIADAAKALNVSQTHVRRFVQGKEQSENMREMFQKKGIVVEV